MGMATTYRELPDDMLAAEEFRTVPQPGWACEGGVSDGPAPKIPRLMQTYLLLGAKARALLDGRTIVSTDDIQKLAAPVMRHRIVPNFTAESEGITSDKVIERLIQETPTRESELTSDPRFGKIFAA